MYLIHCKKCSEAQMLEKIEEISDTDLIITHSMRQKKLLPLPLHFNADDHNIGDLNVCILNGNFKHTKHREKTKLRLLLILKPISLVLIETFISSANMTLLALRFDIFNCNVILFSPLHFPTHTFIATSFHTLSYITVHSQYFIHNRRIVISRSGSETSLINIVRRRDFDLILT